MNDDKLAAQVRRVHEIFGVIQTAATLLEAIEPQKLLDSWAHQEAVLPFTDPTMMQSLLASRDDMARKKRLLVAARDFVREWDAVKGEAIDAMAREAIAASTPEVTT